MFPRHPRPHTCGDRSVRARSSMGETHVSMQEMNGFGLGSNSVFGGRPAMTGSMKKGPKLVHISRVPMRDARRGFQYSDAATYRFSYRVLDTRCVKVLGVISRSSFIRYMLTRNRRCSRLGEV